jgi:hypothetical protein
LVFSTVLDPAPEYPRTRHYAGCLFIFSERRFLNLSGNARDAKLRLDKLFLNFFRTPLAASHPRIDTGRLSTLRYTSRRGKR